MQNSGYKTVEFPRSRIATFDIGAVGKEKHYVTALLELNVGEARRKLKETRKRAGKRISFTGWLLQAIATTISQHKEAAAFRYGRRKLMVFDDVDMSIVVEKEVDGHKVPLPLVIKKVNEKSLEGHVETSALRFQKDGKCRRHLRGHDGPGQRLVHSNLRSSALLRHRHTPGDPVETGGGLRSHDFNTIVGS